MIASAGLVLVGDASALQMCEQAIALITYGPEELFYQARHLAYLGEIERAAAILGRSVDEGFFCYPAIACDPWLNGLRAVPAFQSALRRAQDRHVSAIRRFRAAGGERLFSASDGP